MSDFDHAIDLARDEEYSPPPPGPHSGSELAPSPITWTPDSPSPLAPTGPMPGLFTTAGVDDAPSPLMSAAERQQHDSEAALVAHGGHFAEDAPPSFAHEFKQEGAAQGAAIRDGVGHYQEQVSDVANEYRETGMNQAVPFAPITVAVEDLFGSMGAKVRDSSDHVERALEAPTATGKMLEGAKAVGDLGLAGLDAFTIADPANALVDGIGAGIDAAGAERVLGHAAAAAAPDAGSATASGTIAADAPKGGIDGPLARWTDDEEFGEGGRSALHDLHGEGPETDAMHETGKSGAGMAEPPKHHPYPQEHREWFEDRGMTGEHDIDNLTVEMDSDASHQAIHGGGNPQLGRQWSGEWNQHVMKALKETEAVNGAELTPDEIKAIVENRMDAYDVPKNYVKYKSKSK